MMMGGIWETGTAAAAAARVTSSRAPQFGHAMAFAAILDPQLEQNLVSPWGAPQEGQTAALFGICWPHCLQYMVFTSLY
jgi:hypothetical protein